MNTDAPRFRIVFLFTAAAASLLVALSFLFSSSPAMAQTPPGVPWVAAAKTQFDSESAPALTVSWGTPSNGDRANLGYGLQYRVKGAANWNKALGFGSGTTSTTLTGLQANTEYEVRVQVKWAIDGHSGWNNHFAPRTNRAPKPGARALTDLEIIRGPYATYSTQAGHWPEYFADDDGDTLTPSVQSQYPGLMKALSSTGTDYSIRVIGLNPGISKLTYSVSDGYGGFSSKTVTYTIVDNPQRAVMENSPTGTLVGSPVAGTPYDDGNDETDDSLTHTLHGEAATYFDINADTGQISVKQGTTLDYETKASYTGQVKWTVPGQGGQESVANLTINVGDIEAGKPGTPTLTRTEFAEQSAPALDVTWTAADANGTAITGYEAQYRKKAAGGQNPAAWTIYKYDDPDNPGSQTSALPATATSLNLANL